MAAGGGLKGVALIAGGDSGNSAVIGSLQFYEDPSTGFTHVRGKITGLSPGFHGFHIHSFGDTTNGCNSTDILGLLWKEVPKGGAWRSRVQFSHWRELHAIGPHFNPYKKLHGAPDDKERHAGDLGNILADADGIANVFLKDLQIPLNGPNSILGRAVVVHADPDDLGRGGHELSKSTGNAGARIGCGIIGLQSAV